MVSDSSLSRGSLKCYKFRHSQSTVEIENDLVSEGTESGDDYKKYEDMNEHDQFDVYQKFLSTSVGVGSRNVWIAMRIMNYLGSMLRK